MDLISGEAVTPLDALERKISNTKNLFFPVSEREEGDCVACNNMGNASERGRRKSNIPLGREGRETGNKPKRASAKHTTVRFPNYIVREGETRTKGKLCIEWGFTCWSKYGRRRRSGMD